MHGTLAENLTHFSRQMTAKVLAKRLKIRGSGDSTLQERLYTAGHHFLQQGTLFMKNKYIF
jgi:hypothetical protein